MPTLAERITALAQSIAVDVKALTTAIGLKSNRTDLASTDPDKGAALIGYARSTLLASVTQVHQMLDAQPVGVWEFASLVTSKPTPADPTTWDWTPALQALLNHSNPVKVIPPGLYISNQLTIRTGTKLYMAGVTVQAISSLLTNKPLLINLTQTGSVDTYYDRDIDIFSGVFKGNSGARTNSLLAFVKTFNVKLHGTRVTGNRYQGVQVAGCKHTVFENCEMDLNGNPVVTTEGGAAVWIGSSSDASRSYDTQFLGVHIHDNEWSAAYVNGTDILFDAACRLINNKESCIFGGDSVDLKFFGTIDGTTKKNISGSGIEYGGTGLHVEGATIQNTANGCIDLTDSGDFLITGNKLLNARRDPTSFPTACNIVMLNTVAGSSSIRRSMISNNKIRDATSPSYAGIGVFGSGAVNGTVAIFDNQMSGTTWQIGPFAYAGTQNGASITRRNNFGTNDNAIQAGQFQLRTTAGTQTITGVGFRPKMLKFYTADTSTAWAASSETTFGINGTILSGMFTSAGATARVGGPTGNAVHIADGAGTIVSRASTVTYTDDGFTVTVPSANGSAPYVNWEAYP